MSSSDNLKKLHDLYQATVGRIDETLSPDDTMWDGNEAHYRRVGESAVKCIKLALLAAGRDPDSIKTILDLPSGHGRVLRFLLPTFPNASFTACDTNRGAVDFCATTFNAAPVYSNPELRGIQFPSTYDLIWCGSLFTHFDAPRWTDLLRFFSNILSPEGILVFTTAGPTVPRMIGRGWDYFLPVDRLRRLLDAYRRTGFGYVDYDGDSTDGKSTDGISADRNHAFGLSIARPSWTLARVQEFPNLSVITYLERGWDDHHDVVACVKGRPNLAPGPSPEKTAELDVEGL